MIDINTIKQLREETGAGMLDVKETLTKHNGDIEKARKELIEKGAAKAAKKQEERTTKDGLIFTYIHAGGKVGSMVHVACETDFVAKTEDFQKLCREVALQVAAGSYNSIEEILDDEYVRDSSKKIRDLVTETIAKTGEKIELKNFCRMSLQDQL